MTFHTIKYYLIGLSFCLCSLSFFGQQRKIDSLQNLLQAAKEDTARIRLYLSLAEVCDIKDNLKYAEPALQLTDKILAKAGNSKERRLLLKQKAKIYNLIAIFYSDKSDTSIVGVELKELSIYEEIKDTANIVNSLGFLSAYYSTSGNIPKALNFCQKALSAAEKYNYKRGIAACYGRMGNIYKEQNDYTTALQYFKKRLDLLYQLKDTAQLIFALPQTGRLYTEMRDVANALDCFNKAILLAKASKKDKRDIRYLLNCIGEMYQDNKDYVRALEFFEKTISQAQEWGDKGWVANKYGDLGTIYRLQGNLPKAMEYQTKSLQLLEALNYQSDVMWANLELAITYNVQKNYSKAKFHCEKAYTELKKRFDVRSICNAERLAGKIDSALGNYKEAYYHFQQYIILRDKLSSEEVRRLATKEKYQSEYDKQKTIDKAEQEKKDLATKDELQRQKIVRNSFIGGFALILVLALIVFRSYRQKQKSNHQLAEKNHEIEEKQKEILDSIRYAKRIQTSLLPTDKYIDRILNQKERSIGK